jgi:hypothetical protein
MKNKIIAILIIAFAFQSLAQAQQEKFKFKKVSKDVKKEAKRYEKDGWRPIAGKQPIAQQLDYAFAKQGEADAEGMPVWIIGNGSSIAQQEAAGLSQATDLAKLNLLSFIESNISSVVESEVANNQLSREDAVSITKTIQVATDAVSKKLGAVMPLLSIVRDVDKNYELQIMVAYKYDMVRKMVLEEIKNQLQKETDEVRKKYENFLNPKELNVGEIKNYSETPSTRQE